ncbi:hypothetical protein I7I50_08314 [Histoplasma capsulatum G186AR]|uniref:Uncharacterized protein n=1 Tax=Ajellomyces capsulatus TaxID=5037 RepID=A0A8H7YPX8_AJECA|nr:hypothetical protein I7I52_05830 [Histoplasma capsulatum]QSS73518.1 hypothetical protein I7I50_08314 [Histoplasma capsulatum G186AR]
MDERVTVFPCAIWKNCISTRGPRRMKAGLRVEPNRVLMQWGKRREKKITKKKSHRKKPKNPHLQLAHTETVWRSGPVTRALIGHWQLARSGKRQTKCQQTT